MESIGNQLMNKTQFHTLEEDQRSVGILIQLETFGVSLEMKMVIKVVGDVEQHIPKQKNQVSGTLRIKNPTQTLLNLLVCSVQVMNFTQLEGPIQPVISKTQTGLKIYFLNGSTTRSILFVILSGPIQMLSGKLTKKQVLSRRYWTFLDVEILHLLPSSEFRSIKY